MVVVVGIEVGIEGGIDDGVGMDDEEGGTKVVGSSWVVGMGGGIWEDFRGTWVDSRGTWVGGSGLSMCMGEFACFEC